MKIIVRASSGSVNIEDLLGMYVDTTAVDLLDEFFDISSVTQSEHLKELVSDGDIIVNDGTDDLSISDALNHLDLLTEYEIGQIEGATGGTGGSGSSGEDGGTGGVGGTGGTGGPSTPGEKFDVYDNAGGQVFTSAITVNLDTVRQTSGIYSLSSDELTINATDEFMFIFRVSTELNSGSSRTTSYCWLERDSGGGFVEVPGTRAYMYNRTSSVDENTGTVHAILDVTSGDKFRIRVSRKAGGGTLKTIAQGSGLTVYNVHGGEQGPQGPPGGGGNFGQEAQYAESENESSTTSESWQEKLELSTGSLPEGTYRIGWNYEWLMARGRFEFKGRVQIDDSTTIMEHYAEPENVSSWHPTSGFKHIYLSASSHEIDIDFCTNKSGKDAHIRRARIELWRVS